MELNILLLCMMAPIKELWDLIMRMCSNRVERKMFLLKKFLIIGTEMASTKDGRINM